MVSVHGGDRFFNSMTLVVFIFLKPFFLYNLFPAARVQTGSIMEDNEHAAQDHRWQYRSAW